MAKKKRPTEPTPEILARRRRNRMSRIRRAQADGKPVTEAEAADLAAYDAEPHGNRAADEAEDLTDATAPEPEPDLEDGPLIAIPRAAILGAAPPADALPPLDASDLPPVPKASVFASPRAKASVPGKWQEKYSIYGDTVASAAGREAACVYLASLWDGVNRQMADAIRAAGIDPVVDPDKMRGALVLCVDKVLPPEFELTAEIVAAGGTSALLAQRMFKAKEIKAAQEAARLKAKASTPVYAPAARAEAPPAPPKVTEIVVERIADEQPAPPAPTVREPDRAPNGVAFNPDRLI